MGSSVTPRPLPDSTPHRSESLSRGGKEVGIWTSLRVSGLWQGADTSLSMMRGPGTSKGPTHEREASQSPCLGPWTAQVNRFLPERPRYLDCVWHPLGSTPSPHSRLETQLLLPAAPFPGQRKAPTSQGQMRVQDPCLAFCLQVCAQTPADLVGIPN